MQRLEIVRTQPLLDALRDHDGHPKGVCRHVDAASPWVEQTVTVASVVMNLEKPPAPRGRGTTLHATSTHEITLPRDFFRSARIDSSAVSTERHDDHAPATARSARARCPRAASSRR